MIRSLGCKTPVCSRRIFGGIGEGHRGTMGLPSGVQETQIPVWRFELTWAILAPHRLPLGLGESCGRRKVPSRPSGSPQADVSVQVGHNDTEEFDVRI